MNDFSEQLRQSAHRLRGRRNAGLNVPPCPRPRRARLWRVVEIGAAACVGLLGGGLMPGVDKEPASPLLASADTVVVERIVRDTVVMEIPGRLTENSVTAKENPVSCPAEAEAVPVEDMPAEPRTEPVVSPSSLRLVVPPVCVEDYAQYAVASGRSVRDDSVNYSLFVSL